MSGTGNRFIQAGYSTPKPLIVIDGKPIIEHVCDLFPGEEKFSFICNSKHLAVTNMRETLQRIKPNAEIIEIQEHKKGPVYAVSLAENIIKDDEEVIINYCDFGTYWDYHDFLNHTRNRNADGAIPSYKGFHPHMLGNTNYAFMRDKNQFMIEIKEKSPFTDNRMNEFASNGTYYFKNGKLVKKYFKELMERDINLNGEFYVSLVYNLLKRDGLIVSIYEIQHMLQWGTPLDVEKYKYWTNCFRNLCNTNQRPKIKKNSITVVPLAGFGKRFSDEGYQIPKPLIPVSGNPMVIQATRSLPITQNYTFVALKEHLNKYPLQQKLEKEYSNSKIIALDGVTEGQAISCSLGLKRENEDLSLIIGASDNAMIYNVSKLQQLLDDDRNDAIIFTFRHNNSVENNPHMYGWVKNHNDDAIKVSVKKPISKNPFYDHAIVGAFFFRKIRYFNNALKELCKKNIRVNNEYYVDSVMEEMILLGYKVKIFEIDYYIGWGTPNDYRTFLYWQSFFHKVSWHPYSLEKDSSVNKSEIKNLDLQFRSFRQEHR